MSPRAYGRNRFLLPFAHMDPVREKEMIREVELLRMRDAEFKHQLEALRLHVLTLEREMASWKVKALFPKLEGEERVRMEERLAVAELIRAWASTERNRPTTADLLRKLAMAVEKRT